jgi:hypothetical protein
MTATRAGIESFRGFFLTYIVHLLRSRSLRIL